MFLIQIKDMTNGEIIGNITPEQLQKYMKASRTEFVQDTVRSFNEMKERMGEPERVKMVLANNT